MIVNLVIIKNNLNNLYIFMVYISFLISHVPPAHSFFQKKSILINLTQNLVQLIFKRLLSNHVT